MDDAYNESVVILYVTVPDHVVGSEIASIAIEEGLAACVNKMGPVQASYRWDGVLYHEQQWVLWCKTTSHQVEKLQSRIAMLHPDRCPCMMQIPVTGGWAPFLEWVHHECQYITKTP